MAFFQTTTTEAFDERLKPLNALLDDLYPAQQFEKFQECPIEIRFLIYEATSRQSLPYVILNQYP
jgi:hypothetical protein